MSVTLIKALLLLSGVTIVTSLQCSQIDVVILKGSGILLQDDMFLAVPGADVYFGCYCRNHPNAAIHWTMGKKNINRRIIRMRVAIPEASTNQSVYMLRLSEFSHKNKGFYTCKDKGGFKSRTFNFKLLNDSTKVFSPKSNATIASVSTFGDLGEPAYFFSKLNFVRDNVILAGGMDNLYLLDNELMEVKKIYWPAKNEYARVCTNFRQHEYLCRNHIRFYHTLPGSNKSLIICGTQALYNSCAIVENFDSFNMTGISRPTGGVILTHPDLSGFQMFRNLYEGDPILFSAQHTSFQMDSFGFAFHNISIDQNQNSRHRIRSMLPIVNSALNKQHWMKSPVAFMDGYEDNYSTEESDPDRLNFLFFFFHEEAYDTRNGNREVHSRVARLCKNDEGIMDNFRRVFTSFVKARIACAVDADIWDVRNPGVVDYYYNIIRKVKMVKGSSYRPGRTPTDRIMYGVFTGDRLGPKGSAICVYNATQSPPRSNNNGIYDIFNRDYVRVNYDEDSRRCEKDKETTPNLKPFDCAAPRSRPSALENTLIYADVKQLDDHPLVVVDDATITSMDVDKTLVLRDGRLVSQDVIFVGTDTGELRKIFVGGQSEYKANTVENLMLERYSHVHHIELKQVQDEKVLFVNTKSNIYRLPLQRCARYDDCTECVAAQDPYCYWSKNDTKCTTLPADRVAGQNEIYYFQDVDEGDYTKFGRNQCGGDQYYFNNWPNNKVRSKTVL